MLHVGVDGMWTVPTPLLHVLHELDMTSVLMSSFVHKAELYANAVLSGSPRREEGTAALGSL